MVTTPSEAEMAADDHNDFEEESDHLPFEQDAVRDFLDNCIRFWRKKREEATTLGASVTAEHYVDAYQSMRTSMFGETLPADEEAAPLRPRLQVTLQLWRGTELVQTLHQVLNPEMPRTLVEMPYVERDSGDGATKWTVRAGYWP